MQVGDTGPAESTRRGNLQRVGLLFLGSRDRQVGVWDFWSGSLVGGGEFGRVTLAGKGGGGSFGGAGAEVGWRGLGVLESYIGRKGPGSSGVLHWQGAGSCGV